MDKVDVSQPPAVQVLLGAPRVNVPRRTAHSAKTNTRAGAARAVQSAKRQLCAPDLAHCETKHSRPLAKQTPRLGRSPASC